MVRKLIEQYIAYTEKTWFGMKQKLLFFRELAYLLWGWVGINEAIQIIAQDGDTAWQRYVGRMIATAINEWKTLTNALTRLSTYFTPSDVSIIKAGEASWNLVMVLRNLAQEYAFLHSLWNKFISATTYPIVLLIIAVIAILVLFIGILPGIFSIATQFPGVEMPFVTRMMMWLSEGLKNNVATILIGIGLFLFLCSIIFSSETGKAKVFTIILQIPWFWVLVRNYYLVKMMRYLKLLHQSGMNYVDTLTLLRDIMEIWPYQDMIQNMLQHVQRGEQMYKWIIPYPHLIPSNATILLKVWEETAQVTETLQNINDIYEEDLLARISGISKIIEPVLIVVLWVVIVLIALSVFGIITTILGGVQGW